MHPNLCGALGTKRRNSCLPLNLAYNNWSCQTLQERLKVQCHAQRCQQSSWLACLGIQVTKKWSDYFHSTHCAVSLVQEGGYGTRPPQTLRASASLRYLTEWGKDRVHKNITINCDPRKCKTIARQLRSTNTARCTRIISIQVSALSLVISEEASVAGCVKNFPHSNRLPYGHIQHCSTVAP